MKRNKILTSLLSVTLASMQVLTTFAVAPAINPTSGLTEVILDNKYWYKVKMPGIIDLKYDEDTVLYRDDYELQACGEIPGKMLQIDTDDVDITNGTDTITVENYIGRANLGEKNHSYILGAHEGESALSVDWQTVKGFAKHDFAGVKPGNYAGNTNYKFKLVDAMDASDLKVNVNQSLVMGSGQEQKIIATLNGEDVTDKVNWKSSNENVATVKKDGTVVISDKASAGDSAEITGEIPSKEILTGSILDMFSLTAHASESYKMVSFQIVIVGVSIKDDSEQPVGKLEIYPGESAKIKAYIYGDTSEGLQWSATKNTGLSLNRNGNELTVYLSDDMPEGTTFDLIATVGTYSKRLPVIAKSRHVHTADIPVRENEIVATHDTEGRYDEVVYCSECHKEISRKHITTPKKEYDTLELKTWNGISSNEKINGIYVWTDGDNIYYSEYSTQLVLDKTTSTWKPKTWNGLNINYFLGNMVWTDGNNIYCTISKSKTTEHYILNKVTSTWEPKIWNGLPTNGISGDRVWTDGDNIYYSSGTNHYVLDKTTSTWSEKTWNGLTSFYGSNIWTDEDNTYYSFYNEQLVLDKATSTWKPVTWNNTPKQLTKVEIFTDGNYIYRLGLSQNQNFVLDKTTSTWKPKTWNGFPTETITVRSVWTDGDNFYFTVNGKSYILK